MALKRSEGSLGQCLSKEPIVRPVYWIGLICLICPPFISLLTDSVVTKTPLKTSALLRIETFKGEYNYIFHQRKDKLSVDDSKIIECTRQNRQRWKTVGLPKVDLHERVSPMKLYLSEN